MSTSIFSLILVGLTLVSGWSTADETLRSEFAHTANLFETMAKQQSGQNAADVAIFLLGPSEPPESAFQQALEMQSLDAPGVLAARQLTEAALEHRPFNGLAEKLVAELDRPFRAELNGFDVASDSPSKASSIDSIFKLAGYTSLPQEMQLTKSSGLDAFGEAVQLSMVLPREQEFDQALPVSESRHLFLMGVFVAVVFFVGKRRKAALVSVGSGQESCLSK